MKNLAEALHTTRMTAWAQSSEKDRSTAKATKVINLVGMDFPLTHLDQATLDRLYAQVVEMDVKDTTKRSYLMAFSRVLKTAKEYEAVPQNLKLRTIKVDNDRHRVLSKDEEERILLALTRIPFARETSRTIALTATEFLLETGLRIGELWALRPDDRITVDTHLGPREAVRVRKGKGRKFRVVPLNQRAIDAWDTMIMVASKCSSVPRLWGQMKVAHSNYWRWFKVAKHFANIQDETLVPHSLRHTFATRYLNRGGRIEVLQKILGHSTIGQTTHYGRLNPEGVVGGYFSLRQDE